MHAKLKKVKHKIKARRQNADDQKRVGRRGTTTDASVEQMIRLLLILLATSYYRSDAARVTRAPTACADRPVVQDRRGTTLADLMILALGGNLGVVWVAATTRDSDKEAVQRQTGAGDEATEPGETIEEDQRDSVLLNDERIVEVQRSLPRRLFVF